MLKDVAEAELEGSVKAVVWTCVNRQIPDARFSVFVLMWSLLLCDASSTISAIQRRRA